MNIVFRFFQCFARQQAFAGLVHFQHVAFGLSLRPTEDLLEDVGDIVHQVDGIIPADHQVARIQLSVRARARRDFRFLKNWHSPIIGNAGRQFNRILATALVFAGAKSAAAFGKASLLERACVLSLIEALPQLVFCAKPSNFVLNGLAKDALEFVVCRIRP